MGFYASVEAAALAWDITAASLQRCRKLNFPEVSFADLEQQLDALKCVISQHVPSSHTMQMPLPLPVQMDAPMPPQPSAPNVVAPQDHVGMPQPGQVPEASMLMMPGPGDGPPAGAMAMLPPQPDSMPMMAHVADGAQVPDGAHVPSHMTPPPAPVMDHIPVAEMPASAEVPSAPVPTAEDIPHAEVPGVDMADEEGQEQVPPAEMPAMKDPDGGGLDPPMPVHVMPQPDGPAPPAHGETDNGGAVHDGGVPGGTHAAEVS